jgi:hypothetical protein
MSNILALAIESYQAFRQLQENSAAFRADGVGSVVTIEKADRRSQLCRLRCDYSQESRAERSYSVIVRDAE